MLRRNRRVQTPRPEALPARSRDHAADDLERALRDTRARVEALERLVEEQQRVISHLTADVVRHQEYINDPRADRFTAVAAWLAAAPVSEDLRVSVITPTFNRPARLLRAINSVRAQTYVNWEMIVVDDGSDDDQRPAVEALGDPRVRALRQPNAGVSGANNRGLEEATGELIAYLEDDNTMDPGWLRAAAWAMQTFPHVDLLYGAVVWEEDEPVLGPSRATGLPLIEFRPWDRALLERHCYIHIGAVVHRRGIPAQGFNPAIRWAQDYDFALRATRDVVPLALPAIAGTYATSHADRMTRHEPEGTIAHVQALHGLRPMEAAAEA